LAELVRFDSAHDYFKPLLQGFRLVAGEYRPIDPAPGRLPSQALGLRLERDRATLRLNDRSSGTRLLTRDEQREDARRRAETGRHHAVVKRRRALTAEAPGQVYAAEDALLGEELDSLPANDSRVSS
jgi:hypothetical protein